MRIQLAHVPYIAQKIAIDILNSGMVTLSSGVEPIAKVAAEIIKTDLQKEKAIDERANELMDERIDEFDEMNVNKKDMFWLIKRKLAAQENFELIFEDRYSNISHEILETIWKKNLVDYQVSENRIKTIIYNSIEGYLKIYKKIEEDVYELMQGHSKKLIPGTEEYELVFAQTYEKELKKRGML
ncbi:DUF507 family protein [Campylobacter sp. VBCF_06 NA8]|uniref:DUF507 family protein n=1 Tax=Campylobacter sp. VBCF_06 NA8 TaxID=2983822 RepID=UPI0022E99FBB|nr:DUF507 family protein [Campylobacter sp. VBCF_06 NA8]MDA3045898.1 DUF507 family protein [Campylobacter sp. VBCF_06 NA8]